MNWQINANSDKLKVKKKKYAPIARTKKYGDDDLLMRIHPNQYQHAASSKFGEIHLKLQ